MQSVFSIQRFIEDYLVRLGLDDTDQYSVRVANLYEDHRCQFAYDKFLERVGRVRTVVFRNNSGIERGDVEGKLVKALDRQFMGKGGLECVREFPGGLVIERKRLQQKTRRSLPILLVEFKQAVEAKALDGRGHRPRLLAATERFQFRQVTSCCPVRFEDVTEPSLDLSRNSKPITVDVGDDGKEVRAFNKHSIDLRNCSISPDNEKTRNPCYSRISRRGA